MKKLPLIIFLTLLPLSIHAEEYKHYSFFYENSYGSQWAYESVGIEGKGQMYGANDSHAANFHLGYVFTRIHNLTMNPGETDYIDSYLYYGFSGNSKLAPYVNAGINVGALAAYSFNTLILGCTSGCMPHGSRFITVGMKYEGSFFQIDVYRRFYYLKSDTNYVHFPVTGLRYSLKF